MSAALRWLVATTLGLVIGGFALHFPGSFGGQGGWSLAAAVFGLILGFMTGALVGIMQWASLLLPRRIGMRLVLAMALSVGATHALFDGSPTQAPLPLVAALSGILTAAAFAWLLGERARVLFVASAAAWAVGIAIADILSNAIGLPFEETPVGWSMDHAFDGLIVGIVWGGTTAVGGIASHLPGMNRDDEPGTSLS